VQVVDSGADDNVSWGISKLRDFQVQAQAGCDEVVLSRKYGREVVTVKLSLRDQEDAEDDYDEEEEVCCFGYTKSCPGILHLRPQQGALGTHDDCELLPCLGTRKRQQSPLNVLQDGL
jgi:hypothetical protein